MLATTMNLVATTSSEAMPQWLAMTFVVTFLVGFALGAWLYYVDGGFDGFMPIVSTMVGLVACAIVLMVLGAIHIIGIAFGF